MENPLFSQASMSAAAAASSMVSEPEPADHAAADLLGESDQVGLGDRPHRQERRRRGRPNTEAMRAKVNESPSIKSKMDDVAEAVTAVKRDLRRRSSTWWEAW